MSFKIGDNVRLIGERRTGTITNIIEDTALVQYGDHKKVKTKLVYLFPPLEEVTAEKFDEAVKGLMYEAAETYGEDDEKLDQMLEVIAAICFQLKARLFNGG